MDIAGWVRSAARLVLLAVAAAVLSACWVRVDVRPDGAWEAVVTDPDSECAPNGWAWASATPLTFRDTPEGCVVTLSGPDGSYQLGGWSVSSRVVDGWRLDGSAAGPGLSGAGGGVLPSETRVTVRLPGRPLAVSPFAAPGGSARFRRATTVEWRAAEGDPAPDVWAVSSTLHRDGPGVWVLAALALGVVLSVAGGVTERRR